MGATESDCLPGQESAPGNATVLFAKHSPARMTAFKSCGGRFARETRNYSFCGTPCLNCAPGRSQPNFGPGERACTPCVPGQYQPAAGQPACIPCPSGTHGSR